MMMVCLPVNVLASTTASAMSSPCRNDNFACQDDVGRDNFPMSVVWFADDVPSAPRDAKSNSSGENTGDWTVVPLIGIFNRSDGECYL